MTVYLAMYEVLVDNEYTAIFVQSVHATEKGAEAALDEMISASPDWWKRQGEGRWVDEWELHDL